MPHTYDVVIAGGGPGGSTLAGMLLKYRPTLKVLIVEREHFPREHVGESQLPQIGPVLDELGVWDQIERAGFPVKIGATFKWGMAQELWDFNLVPPEAYVDQQRPGSFDGVRCGTAFQVDRARYDEILLRHAQKLGCEVREGVAVRQVEHAIDEVQALHLSDGSKVSGRYVIDASGHVGVVRRALGVEIDCPTLLKNIAIWDYWTDTAWADTIGKGGTRIQVISVPCGWLWFIPISATRTSLGLVCPVSYYKSSGKTPEQLYTEAIASSDRITSLLQGAARENQLRTTNDWSFVADRLAGKNWFLVGECAGFADPILSAGLTLTHVGARELAYTLQALDEGTHPRDWLVQHYQANQQRRVRQHMRFAEFWYSANAQFTDLQAHCQDIAREAGLRLGAQQAWAWLAQGGFTNDVLGQAGIGGLDLAGVNQVTQRFLDQDLAWHANDFNVFQLNLQGAEQTTIPVYRDGKVLAIPCYERDGKRLAVTGTTQLLLVAMQQANDIGSIMGLMQQILTTKTPATYHHIAMQQALQMLEVLVVEEWVIARLDESLPRLTLSSPREGVMVQSRTKTWTTGSREG